MISETTFASSYTSFWKNVAPNSERLVRRLNLGVDRFGPPITAHSSPGRRAYINEVAFRLFARLYSHSGADQPNLPQIRTEICEEARLYISRFEGLDERQISDPTDDEWAEISSIHQSIARLVQKENQRNGLVTVLPKFRGCGFLDACSADLMIGDELIEIKSGDRAFRATDLRQLLVYCALNHSEKKYTINRVACANPRRGIYFSLSVETLCLELSSKSPAELLSELIYFVSSGDISR